MVPCWIWCILKEGPGSNILGGERLQNAKYLVSKCCLKQITLVTIILVLVYLSYNKTQLVKSKKKASGIQHRNRAQSYIVWWGAILSDTPCAGIYTSHNQNSYKECICIDNYALTQSFWTRAKVIRGKHIVQPTGFGVIPRPAINRMERLCQRNGSNQTPTVLFESKTHKSINS